MRFPLHVNALQGIHQIGAVIRSGEYRPGETTFGPPCGGLGVQPHPHNPRKQREIPADDGRGETVPKGKWRRGWACGRTFSVHRKRFRDAVFVFSLTRISRLARGPRQGTDNLRGPLCPFTTPQCGESRLHRGDASVVAVAASQADRR